VTDSTSPLNYALDMPAHLFHVLNKGREHVDIEEGDQAAVSLLCEYLSEDAE